MKIIINDYDTEVVMKDKSYFLTRPIVKDLWNSFKNNDVESFFETAMDTGLLTLFKMPLKKKPFFDKYTLGKEKIPSKFISKIRDISRIYNKVKKFQKNILEYEKQISEKEEKKSTEDVPTVSTKNSSRYVIDSLGWNGKKTCNLSKLTNKELVNLLSLKLGISVPKSKLNDKDNFVQFCKQSFRDAGYKTRGVVISFSGK